MADGGVMQIHKSRMLFASSGILPTIRSLHGLDIFRLLVLEANLTNTK